MPSPHWIQSLRGNLWEPLDIGNSPLTPEELGWAMSMLCRFGGHVPKFYSVAQHSVLMAENASTPQTAFLCLLHDASEVCGFGDVAGPFKRNLMFERYRKEERRAFYCIVNKFIPEMDTFVVPWVSAFDEYKQLDVRALVTEARDLLAPPPEPWGVWDTPFEWSGRLIDPLWEKRSDGTIRLRSWDHLEAYHQWCALWSYIGPIVGAAPAILNPQEFENSISGA